MEITLEEKLRIKAIVRYLDGENPKPIYEDLGRSKKWFYKWLNRFDPTETGWYKDISKKPIHSPNQTDEKIESKIVEIRTSLVDGPGDEYRYSCVGPEAIQYHMEREGVKSSEIPSLSTIKRIIKKNNLRVNKKKRYKRVRSKGRHTILKPKYIDEMHQIDYVGPRHIKGYGPINSLHLKDYVGRQVAGNQYHGKTMDNVMSFLLDYWTHHPMPKYLQVDNGMCFAGDFRHPKSFSRFIRLALYVGIEVVFIAPARAWMNGTIEEFNKNFGRLFWSKEQFKDLDDIRTKSQIMFETQNEFNRWKLKNKEMKAFQPARMLKEGCVIDANNLPLVKGQIHFIRVVNSQGEINLLNEDFTAGEEYIGEHVWATIEIEKQNLTIHYKDEELTVRKIKQYSYKIQEKMYSRPHSIFKKNEEECTMS